MGTHNLSLKWNSHQRNLVDVFEQLLWNEDLVDVTLACEGVTLKAHKTLLSACSPFFHSLFLEHPSKHPVIIMKDVKFADLKCVIEFMYKGEIIVPQDRLTEFLKTAETLKVKGLTESVSHQSEKSVQRESMLSQPRTSSRVSRVTDEAHLELNYLPQKKRKRIRMGGRKGSSNELSDDEHHSNSKDAHCHIIADNDKTVVECNSNETSQERIAIPQNLHEDTVSILQKDLPTTFDESLVAAGSNIDASSNCHRKENVQIFPSSELLSSEIKSSSLEPLNPSSSAVCTLNTGVLSSSSLLQELQTDIKPMSLMTFCESPVLHKTESTHTDNSLAVTSIKIEASSDLNMCEQHEQPQEEHMQRMHNFIRKSTESTICDLVLSQRGRRTKININGYLMLKNKIRNNSFYWCCDKKVSLQCPGRATTELIADHLQPDNKNDKSEQIFQYSSSKMEKNELPSSSSMATYLIMNEAHEEESNHTSDSQTYILPSPRDQECDNQLFTILNLQSQIKEISSEFQQEQKYRKSKHKKLVCKFCNKQFPYHSYLLRHLTTHSEERPFFCEQCGKGFKRLSHAKSHSQTHLRTYYA